MSNSIINGRYELKKRLSNKGSRKTFLALDTETKKPVVVKILLFDRDFQWQDHKLFERGANALQSLSHPHIPRYLDYFDLNTEKAKGFVQIQSYVPSPSLQQHLDAGRTFSEGEMQQLAKEILEILIYLHNRQPAVIHRDIKPSNILIGDRSGNHIGTVFLVDFDSVQTHGSAQPGSTMTIVGTYGYMPPEQFGGKAYPASDLYSLGATLIAIATGKHPSDLPQKDLRIEFETETNLSPDFTYWLKWLVEPSRDLRLSSALEALEALEKPCLPPKPIPTNLARIGKPNESKIILRQQQNSLHLIIPASGFSQHNFSKKVTYFVLFLVGFSLFSSFIFPFIFSFIFIIFAILQGEFLALWLLIFSAITTGIGFMFMWPFLKGLFWETHLEIDSVNILMYNKMLIKVNKKRASRRDFLALRSRSKKGIYSHPRLLLTTRNQIFDIPNLNAEEKDWLAEQISQWLQVPIDAN
ncbi:MULTISPECIES: serine/threonine-protein kinase [Spirulina sp. CCY15215]|uniref:serine/threonine protein kinase n=1 Tax=Spirulina sp. CCY15215 TaxID=2767591 RepID=UPI00194F7E58|nr:serine/threonine-protein kinase [Spirulina major]